MTSTITAYPTRSEDWTHRRARVIPPARRQDLIIERLDQDWIVSDPISRTSAHLNETAKLVLTWCNGRTTTQQMASRLERQFDLTIETATDHVDQLISRFVANGLLAVKDLG